MSTRLVIADDHEVVRAGLREMLRDTEFEVVGEAIDGEAAVELAAQLVPDIVILDVRMPRLDGLSALKQIRAANSALPVLMFSAYDNARFLALAYAGGAAGFLLKGCSRKTLIDALRQAVAGRSKWRRRALPSLGEAELPGGESTEIEIALTPREAEVLIKLSNGMTNKGIAQELGISYETVKEHVQHILQKIGVTDRTQAAVWAVRKGLV